MIRKLFSPLLLTLFIFSCDKDEISTVGSIELSFTDNGNPVSGAEIGVSSFFRGVLDSNGKINLGPLNSQVYDFELNTPEDGIFKNSFIIVEGEATIKAYEVTDYQFGASVELTNPVTPNNNINYYLTSDIDVGGVSVKNIDKVGIQGVIENGIISFNRLFEKDYDLIAILGEETFVLDFFVDIRRENMYEGNIRLPDNIVAASYKNWFIVSTKNISSNTIVDDVISEVEISSGGFTITFVDSSIYMDDYFVTPTERQIVRLFPERSFNINSEEINDITVVKIINGEDGLQLIVSYTDRSFAKIEATLRMN